MKYSFLIPAFDEEDYVGRAIDSIIAACREAGVGDAEVVVCDNDSGDRTAEVARTHGARVVVEGERCIARARNAAAAACSGDVLVFVDADSTIDAALMRETVHLLEDPACCGGGARVRFEDHERLPLYVRHFWWYWDIYSRLTDSPAGSYLFCRREVWEAVGGFDEGLYASEELEFAGRIKSWARGKGARFRVIRDAFVITSSRKFHWHGFRPMAAQILRLVGNPGNVRRRDKLGLWYERPDRT